MTARIAVLCRYSPSTADREAGTLTIVAMEYSTKRQGAAFPFGWEEGVAERESEEVHLASFPTRS
jgi:hypothetical protein